LAHQYPAAQDVIITSAMQDTGMEEIYNFPVLAIQNSQDQKTLLEISSTRGPPHPILSPQTMMLAYFNVLLTLQKIVLLFLNRLLHIYYVIPGLYLFNKWFERYRNFLTSCD
jgi:hypothetical protein